MKMASHEFLKIVIKRIARQERGRGWREKLNGNYLRLIPGLCLEELIGKFKMAVGDVISIRER
jgi:hypothetical protein